MSSPFLWIILPFFSGIILIVITYWYPRTNIIGIFLATILFILAWQLPLEETISLLGVPGLPPLHISNSLIILGRKFIINNAARPILLLFYGIVTLWFGGAFFARLERIFIPLGLMIVSLMTASIAVRPQLLAALFIEGVVLLSVPLLSLPREKVSRGTLRFLTLQTIGMPFLLLGGSLLTRTIIDPSKSSSILFTLILLNLGFMLTLSIFPFHTWIPMVSEESHPYAAAFVILIIPISISFLAINYIEEYSQFNIPFNIAPLIRLMGMIMAILGGVWAAFDDHFGRIMGFSAIADTGISLLAISLVLESKFSGEFHAIYLSLLIPRVFSLAIWSLSLFIIQHNTNSLSFNENKGIFSKLPFASTSLLVANFSLAGFPLLASFPGKLALWSGLLSISPIVVIFSLISSTGLLVAGLKTLITIIPVNIKTSYLVSETKPQLVLLSIGTLILFVIGLMPQIFIPALINMAQIITTR